MLRWLVSAMVLILAFGGVDAATDVESFGPCDEGAAHEIHGELQDDLTHTGSGESPDSDGGKAVHFCHCAVHAPAVPSSADLFIAPAPQPAPPLPPHITGVSRTPPPVRPPKIG